MSKSVAIQGYQASFHDVAARQFFGDDIILVPCATFAEVFAVVSAGSADYGVVAIENSNHGVISESTHLLHLEPVEQIAKLDLSITQCLIGLPGSTLADIREVHSHPVALSQCSVYLQQKLPDVKCIENADTAGSVVDVRRWNDRSKAAIASSAAADLYGMQVLAEGVENDPSNSTTFVAFKKAAK